MYNLYGWAVSQNLVVVGFEMVQYMSKFSENFINNCNEDNDIGYFLQLMLNILENFINIVII